MLFLRQSTASQEIQLGKFVDDTDFKTAETGLTIANTDIKLWKEGATSQASKNSGGATHMASGWYYAVLDATDTDTVGKLEVTVDVSGALSVRREYQVLEEAVYDALFAASAAGALPVAAGGITTSSFAAGAIDAAAIADGAIDAGALASDAITAAKIAADAISSSELAAAAATEIANAVASGVSGASGMDLIAGAYPIADFEQITSLSTAATLDSTKAAANKAVLINVEGAAVRFRFDGTAPTTGVGHRVAAGGSISFAGDLTKVKAIEESASAKLNIHYGS